MSKSDADRRLELLIFQATPFCNIDCSYCYLPDRSATQRMPPALVKKVVQDVIDAGWVRDSVSVVWHAGEPLAVGVEYLRQLMDACEPLQRAARLRHNIQTNAILIDEQFCELFKSRNVRIGVSLDGPADLHNACRVMRSGRGTFDLVMRGISVLRRSSIPFDLICVLTERSLGRAEEIYDFFSSLGPSTVGFNVDEIEGVHTTSSMQNERFFDLLSEFWEAILRIHLQRRAFRLREVDGLLQSLRFGTPGAVHNQLVEPFRILTVAANGSIGTFSPELLGQRHCRYEDFSIGNAWSDSVASIASNSRFLRMRGEIQAGVARCSRECEYFELCGGGAPSNKVAEWGTFDVTETKYCRATKMVVIDSLLKETRLFRSTRSANIDGQKIRTVRSVLDADTCSRYISDANVLPWELSTSATSYRSADTTHGIRKFVRLPVNIEAIEDALRSMLPAEICGMRYRGLAAERTMCVRYVKGDAFPVHTDAAYMSDRTSRSLFTLVLYLNDNCEGGETYFPDTGALVRPETGMALIFAHGVRHEGKEVISGVKYILHTFIVYSQN